MEFWRRVWRRKWLVVVPVMLSTVAASIVAWRMPIIYRSEARVIVVPQRIPESFVPSSVDSRLEDRLASIKQRVLSRTGLERIVTEFDLYAEERKTTIMEDVIQRMRERDIRIGTMPAGQAGDLAMFTVSFQSTDARVAMRVTEKLASLFINENLEDRSRRAENTNQFLEGHLKELGKQVDELAVRIDHDRLALPRSQVIEYEELQNTYRELLGQRQQSRMAANLENRQIGEQFRIMDPARIPERAGGPDRLTVTLFGAGAGLAAGLLLMLTASMRRPTSAALGPAVSAAAE